MKDARGYYHDLLHINSDAFAHGLFLMAYHSLATALYCALELKDKAMLKEIEQLADNQHRYIVAHFSKRTSSTEPLETLLYSSLCKLAHLRRSLLA